MGKENCMMRLIGIDDEGRLHALSVADIYYDGDDRELTITTVTDYEYTVEDIDRYRAEELIRRLAEDGKAELEPQFRITE